MMRTRRGAVIWVVLFLATAAVATPLDDYIAKPDPSYTYSLVNTIDNPLGKVYQIDMKSQTWRTEKEVNRTLWQHWVNIIVPNDVASNTALLWINGGSNRNANPPSPDMMVVQIAVQSKTVVVDLKQVPNEPLTFADDPGNERTEDAIIAYSWDKYLKTKDPTWPLQLPMVKSAVRAMDTAQDYLKKATGGKVQIKDFVVAGGSKRGWTTWLTAAVDKRVRAFAPIVIDVLNLGPQIQHHLAAYGFYSPAIGDYERMKLLDLAGAQSAVEMLKLVDPYEYRVRYTMPKFVINSSGDQYFPCDSAQFYYKDLPAPKQLLYNPNTEHSLSGSGVEKALLAWYMAILKGSPLPEFSWDIAGPGHTVVTARTKPMQVTLWTATNPTARDFRLMTVGKAWTSTPLAANDKGVYDTNVKAPEKGWTAYFVELLFDSGTPLLPYRFSTEVRVIPDTLPFADKLKAATK